MNMDIISADYQSIREKARKELKSIESRGVSKAETLEDIRETKGKSFRTADLEKRMVSKTNGSESSSQIAKKTAADELAYLSKKYGNYSFVAAGYSKGMRYGSASTVNVAISPQFLAKMANDPELEAEYEKNIAAMQECDEHFRQMQAARGWRVEAQGWAIDKDGGISSWTIVTKDPKAKSHLQTMSEHAEKIRKQKEEKKQEEVKIEEKQKTDKEEKKKLREKLDEIGKEKFGSKFKGVAILGKDNETDDKTVKASQKTGKNGAEVRGINLDMKI